MGRQAGFADEVAHRSAGWAAAVSEAEDAASSVSWHSLHFVAAVASSSLSGTHGTIHTWAS